MSLPKFNPRNTILLIFISLVAALRIFAAAGHNNYPLSNFTPLAAMALFGGTYFNNRFTAIGWPLFTLWLSDILINRFIFLGNWQLFYTGFYWTYGAFALMALVGRIMIKKSNIKQVLLASIVSVLIHWIVTDLGVWLEGTMYSKTIAGFLQCLIAAIPFEIRLLEGTWIYSCILFGSFEWMQKTNPLLAIK